MDGIIRNRNERWEKESDLKRVLYDIQNLIKTRKIMGAYDIFDDLIYFALDQLPVSEGYLKDGEVTEAWTDFEDSIPDLEIDEFYDWAVHPEKYRNG